MRVNGDNKNVIIEYGKIANSLTNSSCNTSIDTNKQYKSLVWKYIQCNKNTKLIVEDYFDNCVGEKTYNGDVYSFIEKNNLWIPYLAGLIDGDGYIKESGTIELAMCMKKVIDKLSSLLESNNIMINNGVFIPKEKMNL